MHGEAVGGFGATRRSARQQFSAENGAVLRGSRGGTQRAETKLEAALCPGCRIVRFYCTVLSPIGWTGRIDSGRAVAVRRFVRENGGKNACGLAERSTMLRILSKMPAANRRFGGPGFYKRGNLPGPR